MLRDFERRSGLQAHLIVTGNSMHAGAAIHTLVHSVMEQALTNVIQHAAAHMVLISVRYEPGRVDVVIQDDGVGAPDIILQTFQDSYLHFGLRSMRQQTIERGGTFEVANGDESGLVVRFSVPLSNEPT
jgi:signal transduction histidine kinase